MEAILIYLSKSAVLASIFLIVYLLLLKNDTAFHHNRNFLLGGIVASLALPSVEFTRKVFVEATIIPAYSEYSNTSTSIIPTPPSEMDWWQIAGIFYLIISSLLLFKFLFQIINLIRLISHLPRTRKSGLIYCSTSKDIKPFSFFKYILYNPELHTPEELEMILTHEEAHARQWHSLDVLLVHLFCMVLWINPLTWLYKKSLIRNLEYLADQEVAQKVTSKVSYQKTLLKVTMGGSYPALTNPFYQSFLKNRIMMLNRNTSSKSPFWKASLVLPFIFLFLFSFNIKTVAQVKQGELIEGSYSYQSDIHFAIITKNLKDADLENLKKEFAEKGVVLDFTELKRSAKGEIIGIGLSYKVEKTGNFGSYSQTEPEGIATVTLSIGEGKVSISSYSPSSSPKHERGSAILSKIGEKPLIILAEREYKKDDLNGKYIWIKGGLQVLNASEASKKYGSKGKNGVIVISEGEIIDDYYAHLKEIDRENQNVQREYLGIMEGQHPIFSTVEKRKDGKPSAEELIPDAEDIIAIEYDNQSTRIITQDGRPLIVIDGKIQDKDFKLNQIESEKIKTLNVLKAESAVEKYGEKGKNGVLEIELKTREELENPKMGFGQKENKEDVKKSVRFTADTITFDDSEGKGSTSISISGVTDAMFENGGALYVIDGKEMDSDFDASTIVSENIESINVIKGQKAIKKYGNKAKEGVIEITTKK